MSYYVVKQDGTIFEKDEMKYLSKEELIKEVSKGLVFKSSEIDIVPDTDSNDVYSFVIPEFIDNASLDEKYYFVMKNCTPGGRSSLPNEQRIQVKSEYINHVYEQKKAGDHAFLLGVYKDENEEPIFCTWQSTLSQTKPSTPVSKQIKVETISNAYKYGFAQQKRGDEYTCAFRKEFLIFYIKNLDWIHNFTINEANDESLLSDDFINIEHNRLNRLIQTIYYGAPGTGKSYQVSRLIETVYPNCKEINNPYVFKTTVYSDYSYFNFVGNIMPVSKDGEISYDFQAGIFTQALTMAFKYPDKDIFLVVEEMSRGNIASIFGDLFQLLDRDNNGKSEYSINNDMITQCLFKEGIIVNKVYLPLNFHVLGTVNTSDQNVNVMDTAFKRRFDLKYVDVNPVKGRNNEFLNSFEFELADGQKIEWIKLYMSLNTFIIDKLGLSEDKQIGQFFIKFENLADNNQKYSAIQNKLLHYLWDDVQGAAMVDDISIFRSEYSSFSKLYKAFGLKENVFSDDFKMTYNSITF